jgi:hypothetical protein
VDGQIAMRWDLMEAEAGAPCTVQVPAEGYLPADMQPWGEMLLRVYAIPTSNDTILLMVGSDAVNFAAVSAATDTLVRSMNFE